MPAPSQSHRTTVFIPVALRKKATAVAQKDDRTLSYVIRKLLLEYVEQNAQVNAK
jgi:hypothetical protein